MKWSGFKIGEKREPSMISKATGVNLFKLSYAMKKEKLVIMWRGPIFRKKLFAYNSWSYVFVAISRCGQIGAQHDGSAIVNTF